MTDDLISRQALIEALHTRFRDGFDEDKWWNSTHVLAAIEELPSAQPEQRWEKCTGDCDYCTYKYIVPGTDERIDREPQYYCGLFTEDV